MITRKRIKKTFGPIVRFLEFRILHIQDSAHRIALGAALGILIAFMPVLGLHILLAIAMAFILRANKFVAIAMVWISNPLTFVPIYYSNYLIGRMVVVCFHPEGRLNAQQVESMLAESLSPGYIITNFYTAEMWQRIGTLAMQIGLELTIGGLVIGGTAATIVYFAIRSAVRHHRLKHPHHGFEE